MLTFTTLASGSSGNCLLLSAGETHLLVDAGISCRRICTGLKELGVTIATDTVIGRTITVDELMEELRMKGITDLNSIKYAILETNGQISVLPYAAQQPVTAAQMELHPKEPGLPLVIINDGRVLEHNLRQRGLDDIWLDRQLKAHHVKRSQDVFLLTVDEQNQVYLAEKEGRV